MLKNLFTNTASAIGVGELCVGLFVSLILGILIALTHKITAKHTKGFLITLAVLPLLVEIIIILVNGNLGTSVAIMGAFSLIRFRSLPGSAKEILSIFFTMTIGLALGIGYIPLAIVVTFIGCLALILFEKLTIFDVNKFEKVLVVVIPESLDYTSVFDEEFQKYTNKVKLEKVKTINMGSMFELAYRITLKKDINEKEFLDNLRVKNGNLKIILSHPIEGSDL